MRYVLIGAFLILALALASCAEQDIEEYESVPPYQSAIDNESAQPYHGEIDREPESPHQNARLLEDVDYLFYILENNFPLLNAAQRTHGIDVAELKENTRQAVKSRQFRSDAIFKHVLEREFFRHFGGFGHLFTLDNSMYHLHLAIGGVWEEVLDNPASKNFYGSPPDWLEEGAYYFVVENNISIDNIEQGRIARISIGSFSHGNIEHDRELVQLFLQDIADYEHLIIDIRGNGGGSSFYFTQVFMQYLIDAPLLYRSYIFAMDGEHARRFYMDSPTPSSSLIFAPTPEGFFDRFLYFNTDDAHLLAYHFYSENIIQPAENRVGFDGKIWLLIDGRNFSAADYVATITQQTGFATIVGTPTGGAGIGGQPIVLALPNTGIAVRFQGMYSVNHLGRNGYEFTTQPDIPNREGMDALQTVLALIEEGVY